jgi:hypothetical protein
MASVQTFQVEQLTLVGVRHNVYPQETCGICRGSLNNVCVECHDKELAYKVDCKVIKVEESDKNAVHYHGHCHGKMSKVK